jgi:hypothetical protein|tara:strand:- start:176 stop:298 length:123 start_codon:yes stop_codon:yes gene_type:complete
MWLKDVVAFGRGFLAKDRLELRSWMWDVTLGFKTYADIGA